MPTIAHIIQLPADSDVAVGTPAYWNGTVAEMTVPAGAVVANIGSSDGPAQAVGPATFAAWLAPYLSSSGASATTVEVDLGSAKSSGKFTITDALIAASSKVLCWQAPGPYTGKGTRADEAEMQPVQVIAVEPASGSAVVKWQTPPVVVVANTRTRLAPNTGSGTLANRGTNRDITVTPRRIGLVKGNVKFSYMVMS